METKNPKTIIASALRDVMCERFPSCFSLTSPKPLKIGITNDLVERCPDISYYHIKLFIKYYTCNFGYCRVSIDGAERVDLDGTPAGIVTAAQAGYMAARLKQSRKKYYERKKAALKAEAEATT